MQYSGGSRGHRLADILDDGLTVVLEDASHWQVYDGFADRCATWQPGQMLTVKPGKDPEFPYLLVNVDRNESVECRLVRDRAMP